MARSKSTWLRFDDGERKNMIHMFGNSVSSERFVRLKTVQEFPILNGQNQEFHILEPVMLQTRIQMVCYLSPKNDMSFIKIEQVHQPRMMFFLTAEVRLEKVF